MLEWVKVRRIYPRWRYDIVATTALLVLAASGAIPADHVFNGFGNPL